MPNKPRRQLIAILAMLAVGVAWSCLLVGKARERKEFVSPVDNAGYRYRFTMSSAWKNDIVRYWDNIGVPMPELSFSSPAPNPERRWINDHLLHIPPSNPDKIYLRQELPLRSAGVRSSIVDGYPEPFDWFPTQRRSIRHFRIDGYPATSDECDIARFHLESLLVYVADHRRVYEVTGVSESANHDQLHREMQAIIDSFHIEKVGKR
jgi:hypothetical protein